MKIKLQHDVWRIELPESLVMEAGFSRGEELECQVFPGGISLSSQDVPIAGAAGPASRAEKKFATGAEAFLPWLFSAFLGRRTSALEKREGQGTAGTACL